MEQVGAWRSNVVGRVSSIGCSEVTLAALTDPVVDGLGEP